MCCSLRVAQDVRQGRQQPVNLLVCAHGYPKIVGDARRRKMADDHRPLAQRGGQLPALMFLERVR